MNVNINGDKMINILNDIFKKIEDNAINKAETECENGLSCTYECFYKDNHIVVLFRTRSYTGETLAHWGEHDNDFAQNKPYDYPFFKIKATKDEYINLITYYIEKKWNNTQRWGKDVVNSLHFNLITGDD